MAQTPPPTTKPATNKETGSVIIEPNVLNQEEKIVFANSIRAALNKLQGRRLPADEYADDIRGN